jgi:hypothetical protein
MTPAEAVVAVAAVPVDPVLLVVVEPPLVQALNNKLAMSDPTKTNEPIFFFIIFDFSSFIIVVCDCLTV